MNNGPRYEDLTELLFRRLRELRAVYQDEFSYWHDLENDPPGPHVVYGNLLNPLVLSLVATTEADRDIQQLARVFGLFEEMANCADVEVRNVVTDTFCWYLTGRPEYYELAKPFMGPRTLELCRTTEP